MANKSGIHELIEADTAAMANDDVIERLLASSPHQRTQTYDGWEHCVYCDEAWPCREAQIALELRASRARIAELEQDARRLDWLLNNRVSLDVRHLDGITDIESKDEIDAAMAGGDEGEG